MEHTEEYLQAKWVTTNPDGYDKRDVVDAKRYCNAYLDGYNQALRIHYIVEQSEQLELVCDVCKQQYTNEELKIGHCFNCGEQNL